MKEQSSAEDEKQFENGRHETPHPGPLPVSLRMADGKR